MPNMTKETLALDSFPKEARETLSEAFDTDGNGVIDCDELIQAAKLYKQTKATNSLLRKAVAGVALLSVSLVATIAALTHGIVQANKDTQVEGRALLNKAEEPVSVGTNEMQVPLAALPFMPDEVSSKVGDISFYGSVDHDDESTFKVYHRKISAIDIIPEESITLETTASDIINWNINSTNEVSIVLRDGTSWIKSAECVECTSTNVFPSPGVMEGMKTFEDATGSKSSIVSRRLYAVARSRWGCR